MLRIRIGEFNDDVLFHHKLRTYVPMVTIEPELHYMISRHLLELAINHRRVLLKYQRRRAATV